MIINKLIINKWNVLENINIEFLEPESSNNSINVIAGINGSGKTSILEMIYNGFRYFEINKENSYFKGSDRFRQSYPFDFTLVIDQKSLRFQKENGKVKFFENDTQFFDDLVFSENGIRQPSQIIKNCIDTGSRVIYMPMTSIFSYSPQINFNNKEAFTIVIDAESVLGNADLYIKNYILSHERKSDAPAIKRTFDAVNSFNHIFKDTQLLTKLVDLDDSDNNRPLFQTITGEKVHIEQLCSGEQQLYGRVVALMILNPKNSIILIDEPDIALHPEWQMNILDIYRKIGENNQFIITTHSPQLISNTHFSELTILLTKNDNVIASRFAKPPISRDINSILEEIMGTKIRPVHLENLYTKYFSLFQEDSPEAAKIRNAILELESEQSEFMQNIDFYRELKE